MFRAIFGRLKALVAGGDQPDRVFSILVPFLIISLGLGALAWRSYDLSVKMEGGATNVARQYAGYAAEITARRVDAAVRSEMGGVSDEWQQLERRIGDPTFAALREWITHHDWIVEAVYVPDYDPASSVYVNELSPAAKSSPRLNSEFYTSTGMVKYTYDPELLLAKVQSAVRQQPLIQQQADVSVVRGAGLERLEKTEDGFAFVEPLSQPLSSYGIRARVRTAYVGGSGWQNQRLISLSVSLLALALTSVGVLLALRGMKKEAETNSLRGALIANVSHELRTPLSMIRLGAETLKRGKLRDNERREIEEQILREVLLLSHLVENVLDVARIQNRNFKALAFTPVHPRDLIHNLISTYESWIHSKGFTVTVQLDETIGEQMWDRDSVSRALLNLIDNAIKYSADDKTIDVVLRQTPEHIVIDVRDRGIGIDSKHASRIFDPYYRAHFSDTVTRRGAGLGLTLVQQIVESHGGRVEVESAPGVGSTFRLLFPRALSGSPAREPGTTEETFALTHS